MKLIDISMEIRDNMPVYKGRAAKRPSLTTDSDFTTGTVFESRLHINLHTGTHLDTPLHMIPGGDDTKTLLLERLVCNCKVLDFSHIKDKITREDLEAKGITSKDFVLLKTRNSIQDLLEGEYVYLDETGAAYLSEKGVSGAGIDALSIERDHPNHETHKILLSAGILILEGLRLGAAEEGEYFLSAAPLNIAGAEAAPVRAFLMTDVCLK